jgi:hypothetical protein
VASFREAEANLQQIVREYSELPEEFGARFTENIIQGLVARFFTP